MMIARKSCDSKFNLLFNNKGLFNRSIEEKRNIRALIMIFSHIFSFFDVLKYKLFQ